MYVRVIINFRKHASFSSLAMYVHFLFKCIDRTCRSKIFSDLGYSSTEYRSIGCQPETNNVGILQLLFNAHLNLMYVFSICTVWSLYKENKDGSVRVNYIFTNGVRMKLLRISD